MSVLGSLHRGPVTLVRGESAAEAEGGNHHHRLEAEQAGQAGHQHRRVLRHQPRQRGEAALGQGASSLEISCRASNEEDFTITEKAQLGTGTG